MLLSIPPDIDGSVREVPKLFYGLHGYDWYYWVKVLLLLSNLPVQREVLAGSASMGIVNLLNNKSIAGTRQSLISKVVLNGVDNWFGNLYYRTNGTDPAYLIRIAELYLIRAEAYAQDNDIAKSLADLNVIRKRADIQELNIADKATLLLAIEQENRIEFAFENHRWYDLVRTRRAKTVLGIDEDFRLLLPIPYAQILIDKNLEQNPQYK